MKKTTLPVILAVAVACLSAISSAHANLIYVENWDFETPDVTSLPNQLIYNPTGAGVGWTFNNLTGIAANNGAFLVENAPDGQAGFVQNASGTYGSMSQLLSGFIGGNYYMVRFLVEGRQESFYGTNPLAVSLGGQTLTFTYNNLQVVNPVAGTTFYSYTSVPITGLDGTANLIFSGLADPTVGDKTTFVDNVQVYSPGDSVPGPFGPLDPSDTSAVPEPGQVAASLLLLGGIGGYVFLKRRKTAKATAPVSC